MEARQDGLTPRPHVAVLSGTHPQGSVIFLLEIITAVLAFVFRIELTSAVEKYLVTPSNDVIDSIHEYFECCDQNDWDLNEYFNCSPEACGVPFSCCMTKDERINRSYS